MPKKNINEKQNASVDSPAGLELMDALWEVISIIASDRMTTVEIIGCLELIKLDIHREQNS